tara:strand:+ start:1919 stop:2680 length:762 start_codon:yes stop_codon:yes gene_type:complete
MTDQFHESPETADSNAIDTERFRSLLTMAMVSNSYSQRKLCEHLGITMGTIQKYFKGKISPFQVRGLTMGRLADCLGVSIDSIYQYLQHGEFKSTISLEDVVSYIKAHGRKELPQILAACSEASTAEEQSQVLSTQATTADRGYTDEEASQFERCLSELFTAFVQERGASSLIAWNYIQAELSALKCNDDEIGHLHDLAFGMKELTGDDLTKCRDMFAGRFDSPCPLVSVLKTVPEKDSLRHKLEEISEVIAV